MFAFIENLFLKNKAKKILSYVDKVETALTLFQSIDNNEDKNTKFIRSLSKKELYTVSTIRKSDAIIALQNAGVSIPKQCTFASLNKNGRYYWANPDASVVLNDWWIILNDGQKRELHCFMVPGNTLAINQFWVRKDRNAIDFEVYYGEPSFIDRRSKISFAPWRIKTIKY